MAFIEPRNFHGLLPWYTAILWPPSCLAYIPAIVALVVVAFLRPQDAVLTIPDPDYTHLPVLGTLNEIGNACFLGWAFFSTWTIVRDMETMEMQRQKVARGLVVFLGILVVAFLILMAGSVLERDELTVTGILLDRINNIGFLFLSYRCPEFTLHPQLPIPKAAGPRPDPGADRVLEKVRASIEREHAYRDPNISLLALSHRLSLESYQISRALNQKQGIHFRNYNSKSSFNAVFQQSTGLSPSEYRKRNRRQAFEGVGPVEKYVQKS